MIETLTTQVPAGSTIATEYVKASETTQSVILHGYLWHIAKMVTNGGILSVTMTRALDSIIGQVPGLDYRS